MKNSTAKKKKQQQSEPLTSVTVNNVPIVWNEGNHGLSFFGTESVIFWLKPSLISMLHPLQEELGEDLYAMLIAYEASKGTYEDYYAMVDSLGSNFEEGFYNWGQAVSAAGWGTFHIESIDWDTKKALVRIDNPWELKIYSCKNLQDNVPFLNGKVSGIFSHAFSNNCRAKVVGLNRTDEKNSSVTLLVEPSNQTLEEALLDIHSKARASEKSQLRAANNSLRRNQRRLLDVIRTVGEFVWETDRHLQITHVTDKAYEILHHEGTNLVGRAWADLLPELEFKRLSTLLSSLSEAQPFVEGDFAFHAPDGEQLWLHLRAKRLSDFSGNHLGYVGSCRDTTDQKRLQAKISEQQQLAEHASKMATLGHMAGGVAHEINSPLAAISLLSEQLAENFPEGSEQLRALQTIHNSTEKISKIILGLRAFARDTSKDSRTVVTAGTLIDDILSLCRRHFEHSGIEMSVSEIAPDLFIKCRSTEISQALLNLLNNSFDAIATNPKKWIRVMVSGTPTKVIFQVSDSGTGIPGDIQNRLMEPFFTTKPIGSATGLGLSISKGLIESHSGSLYYDSSATNTTFVIELPRCTAE